MVFDDGGFKSCSEKEKSFSKIEFKYNRQKDIQTDRKTERERESKKPVKDYKEVTERKKDKSSVCVCETERQRDRETDRQTNREREIVKDGLLKPKDTQTKA